MATIRLKEVTKKYKKSTILSDVNVTVHEGDVFGIIGQSGSGKTTLLNMVAGFVEPTEGAVLFATNNEDEGKDLNDNLHKFKKKIGFTPQHNSFYPKLTVEENLWHFGKMYGLKKTMLENNIKTLLNFTQLYDHRHKLAEELSGGMQKRLDISCSLVHKPEVLILDEPTADLDPILQKEIVHLLQEVNKQGVTVVIASHHLDSIEHMCNKVAIVHNKKVHSHGHMEDVRKPYLRDHFTISMKPGEQKEEIIARLKACPIKKIIDKGNNIVVYPEDMHQTTAQLLDIIKDNDLNFHDMSVGKPSLNEVFEKIVLNKDEQE